MASLALLIALLASSLPAVDSKTFALCSDPGCIVLNSTKSPPLPDIGVHLTTTNDAEVQEVWLLPGSYDADTQELSGIEGLLKPFFDAPDVDKGLGFDVDINDTAITVFMHHNASLLAYGSEHFQGQSSTKDEKKLKSFILRTNVTALVDVSGGEVDSLQLWDGVPSTRLYGLGDAEFTLSKLARSSDVADDSDLCPRGQFKDGNKCSPCDSSCATCWKGGSSQCLSCDLSKRLYDGSCYNNFCTGGAYQINGIGACLEDLLLDADSGQSSKSKNKADENMSNEDLLQILLPAVLGGVVVLGIIVTFLIRRRRGQQTQVLAREHLSNWTSQQKVNSLAAQGPQDKNHWPLSIDSAQKLQYGSPYGDSPYYEMETYRSPSPKRDDQSSPSSTYFDGPVYSVPPFSEGGPDVKDDWDSRKVSLQTRIENELARRRLEIKAVANLQRKRSEDSLRRRALESRAKAFSPTEVISEEDDAFEELESAFSPRTLRKSVPPTTVFAQSRPTTPRSIASPKKSHSRNNSGDSGSAKRTHSRNNSGNSGPSQQTHTRNGSADKIDSWRKRNTRPDPVPPAETIASSTPLQTPTSKISNSRTDRITEWISTPKDTPTRPETIIEPERRKTHSRKGSNESNRTAKQSTQRGPARLERSQDLLPQSSEGRSKDIDDSQSDALTSVSRNGAKQAALATKRNETLKRIKEEEAKQERGAMLTGGSSAPAGQNSAAVLLESMSELLDADSYMPKSFQQ